MRIPTKFLLSRSSFYSALLSYMRIPTKFLLSRLYVYIKKLGQKYVTSTLILHLLLRRERDSNS